MKTYLIAAKTIETAQKWSEHKKTQGDEHSFVFISSPDHLKGWTLSDEEPHRVELLLLPGWQLGTSPKFHAAIADMQMRKKAQDALNERDESQP